MNFYIIVRCVLSHRFIIFANFFANKIGALYYGRIMFNCSTINLFKRFLGGFMKIVRINNRLSDQLRNISITRNYTKFADGAVLIEFGDTKVICTASIDENVPQFLKGKKSGWISAEYSMLPRATHTRNKRDSLSGKVNPRAQEISRLIGRSLRSGVDLNKLGERQIILDCDVLQADGGTRTASITGAFVALHDAVSKLLDGKLIKKNPIKHFIAAVSVGVYQGVELLDLDYEEDNGCDTDMNLVMTEDFNIVEIQGTAEKTPFNRTVMNSLLDIGQMGIAQLIKIQKQALKI